ncbi:MAG: porin family protein, partial [Methylobacillus sp.]|nr:porin family protein [Methylobacillus sp.]
MKNKLITLALASTFAFSAGSASAGEVSGYTGTWYLMPSIGLAFPDNDLKAEDNATAYSFRIGKELSEHWDVQLGLTYTNPDADDSINIASTVVRRGAAPVTVNTREKLHGDYKQTLFGVDALYMFSRDKFRPFLLAGLGVARNNIDYSTASLDRIGGTKTSWMANVGAGFQYHFNDVVGIQADVREVWSRAKDRTDTLFNGNETVG